MIIASLLFLSATTTFWSGYRIINPKSKDSDSTELTQNVVVDSFNMLDQAISTYSKPILGLSVGVFVSVSMLYFNKIREQEVNGSTKPDTSSPSDFSQPQEIQTVPPDSSTTTEIVISSPNSSDIVVLSSAETTVSIANDAIANTSQNSVINIVQSLVQNPLNSQNPSAIIDPFSSYFKVPFPTEKISNFFVEQVFSQIHDTWSEVSVLAFQKHLFDIFSNDIIENHSLLVTKVVLSTYAATLRVLLAQELPSCAFELLHDFINRKGVEIFLKTYDIYIKPDDLANISRWILSDTASSKLIVTLAGSTAVVVTSAVTVKIAVFSIRMIGRYFTMPFYQPSVFQPEVVLDVPDSLREAFNIDPNLGSVVSSEWATYCGNYVRLVNGDEFHIKAYEPVCELLLKGKSTSDTTLITNTKAVFSKQSLVNLSDNCLIFNNLNLYYKLTQLFFTWSILCFIIGTILFLLQSNRNKSFIVFKDLFFK